MIVAQTINKPKGIVFTLPHGIDSIHNPEEYMKVLSILVSEIFVDIVMNKSEYDEHFKMCMLYKENPQYRDEIENAEKRLKKR